MTSDADDLAFFALPGAVLTLRRDVGADRRLELQLLGNRAGVASLANALLWLHANRGHQQEFSLSELPYLQVLDGSTLLLRVVDEADPGFGRCSYGGHDYELDWLLSAEQLLLVALGVHKTAALEAHEYELFDAAPDASAPWDAAVRVRVV